MPSAAPSPATPAPAAAVPPPPRRGHWVFWSAAVVAAGVLASFGIPWFSYRESHSITEDAFVEAHIVNVAPEMVSGRIVSFLVQENDRVKEGQVLAEIEPVHYQDQVKQARGKLKLADAELKRQEAGLAKLKKEVPLQVDVARAAVEVARANLTLARQEYDRWTALAREDATTTRRAQEVTRAFDAAKAEVQLADKRLALAETGTDQIREVELMVAVKKEMVQDAKIALKSAEHTFQFVQVCAPFPGVVVKCYRHLGDSVSAGVPLLSMYNADLLYVTANLPETRLRGVAPGNPVELHLNAFDRPFQGRVVWINKSTGAEFALMPRNVVSGEFTWVVQRVPVRIAIEKDDRWSLLRAGLSVRAVIAHGAGDPEWAEQAAREMADLEARYNRPPE
jgi:membrane fusion protein (multidrug efflux system)